MEPVLNKTGLLIEKKRRQVASLKVRKDFLRLRSGQRFSNSSFVLQCRSQLLPGENFRVGYTVTTKVGNAVVRNRIKRRLREVVELSFPGNAKAGYDYVIIAKRGVLNKDFASIVQDMEAALDHVHRIRSKRLQTKHKRDSTISKSQPDKNGQKQD